MIESALFTICTTNVALAALITEGTSPARFRMYPLVMPQHEQGDSAQHPCLVYTKVGATRGVSYAETDNVVNASFQIDSYATDFLSALALADAVRTALVDYSGTVGSTKILTANLVNEFTLDDPDPGLFRVSQQWSVWFVE